MHQHLRAINYQCVSNEVESSIVNLSSVTISAKEKLIVFFALLVQRTDYAFREWKYATFQTSWNSENDLKYKVCADTDCIMFLKDRKFIQSIVSKNEIKNLISLISVREIKNKIHHFSDYVLMTAYVKKYLSNNTVVTIRFQREIHLIDDLKIKMLIDINIMSSEKIQLNLSNQTMRIDSCQNVTIKIYVIACQKSNLMRTVRSHDRTTVSSSSLVKISVKFKQLSKNREFLFKSNSSQYDLYTHIVNSAISFVQFRNDFDSSIIIDRHVRLSVIKEYIEDDCFLANSADNELAFSSRSR